MKPLDPLEAQLVDHEGLRLHPYTDTVGKLTIGVGRNLTDVGISTDEAYYLLDNDIAKVKSQLDTELPWWRGLDLARQRAIVDLGFNMGVQALAEFHHTLSAIANHNWIEAVAGLRASKWIRQVQPARSDKIIHLIEFGF